MSIKIKFEDATQLVLTALVEALGYHIGAWEGCTTTI